MYCFRPFVVRSCLELFCFLSFVSFVLRHLCSGTHRRNPKFAFALGCLCKCMRNKSRFAQSTQISLRWSNNLIIKPTIKFYQPTSNLYGAGKNPKIQKTILHNKKVLLRSFQLNGHTLGFHTQSRTKSIVRTSFNNEMYCNDTTGTYCSISVF